MIDRAALSRRSRRLRAAFLLQLFEDPLLAELGEVARRANLHPINFGQLYHRRETQVWELIGAALQNLIAAPAPQVLETQKKFATDSSDVRKPMFVSARGISGAIGRSAFGVSTTRAGSAAAEIFECRLPPAESLRSRSASTDTVSLDCADAFPSLSAAASRVSGRADTLGFDRRYASFGFGRAACMWAQSLHSRCAVRPL